MGIRVHDGALVVINGELMVMLDQDGIEHVGDAAPCPYPECDEHLATQKAMDDHLAWHDEQEYEAAESEEGVYVVTTIE